jgi:phosphoglucomutase/phosphomannomutase
MDRAAALAAERGADLVLATDPDADRLGGMVPDRDGEWRFVTGNEIAALLTHFKLSKLVAKGEMPASPIVVTTEVTTELVSRIARHFKAQVVDNLLVGFKYIAEVLWQLERNGAYEDVRGTPEDFVIASEESHGILVTPRIRDKDAGGAALLFAELALDQKRRGKTVLDYIDQLYRTFGYFRTEGLPVVMTGIEGKENMARMLNALRAQPPREIGGLPVTAFEDLRDERGRLGPIKGATDAAARNFLIFRLGDRGRVVLRPSGTEPKAKTYVEAWSAPCPAGATPEQWRRTCREVDELVRRLADDFQHKALHRIGLRPGLGGR